MSLISRSPRAVLLIALLAGPATASLALQPQDPPEAELSTSVAVDPAGATMAKGPVIEGIISARSTDRIQITAADGTSTLVAVNDETRIKSRGGFLGLNSSKLASAQLANGLPVTVKTLQSGDSLMASQIDLKNKDLRTVAMIHGGTDQRFAEQTAATEALRGRVGDIGEYNIKGTTNVNFDTGKAVLSAQAKNDLCATATQAEGTKNALLLVVGYTDSTGSEELNQVLSEKRAARVVNYLQQACGWKPYRMLTPTGMSEADPMADNETPRANTRIAASR